MVAWDKGLDIEINVRTRPSEPNVLPVRPPKQRPLHCLVLGTPDFDQPMDAIAWSRSGYNRSGAPVWRTSLQYGDGPANSNEKGLYANAEAYPGTNAHIREVSPAGRHYVRLHTRRLATPVAEVDFKGRATGRQLPFQAAMLSGQTIPELCQETGLWEFEFVSPDRFGAWSAHWMMGVRGGVTVWPPEIDVFEHFNGAYGPWDPEQQTSAALHYGEFGKSREGVRGATHNFAVLGEPLEPSLTEGPHRSQCLVTPEFITIFMDNREIVQFRHIMKPVQTGDTRLFHPLVNVAVAPPRADDPYDQGSGDMLFLGYRYYALEQLTLQPLKAQA